ncbi:hypothetical protein DSO57_1025544 [Entomophthora muscae]|uniref:Uncharacterized protein n=1 Tax=Entomophthora muscae TaxID=34485 RepID=A0ACC2RGW4_9FUNG|nr:hypothetical protein DSO57_1025544 [Entomophthora muscae]
MKVRDLVAYSNHQREYQAALVHRLDLSFAEVKNYAHQNQAHHVQTSQRHNSLPEQLNTQLPSIVSKILDLRRASQSWCQDITCHILAVEHYVEDASCGDAIHQEETGCCTSELEDVCSKLEALTKEFKDFSWTNQSELNRIEEHAITAEANIVELKDNFLKYDDHLKMVLKEKLATFYKEVKDKLLLTSQTPAVPGITNTVPKMDEIQRQIDSLAISNNKAFLEINKVNERHK